MVSVILWLLCSICSLCGSQAVWFFEKLCSRVGIEKLRNLVGGTSLKTFERQTQPELLYSELPNRGGNEEAGAQRCVRDQANLAGAIEATPSMMEDVDEDDAPTEHVSKQVGIDGDMNTPNLRRRTAWVDPK